MFSVVIPLYNKEKHILRAINSVLNQNYQNFEIIIVNDGSTDNSAEIVKQIKNKKIKLFQQENKGVSAARNKGIELSQRKYIAFLDADDIWEPFFLDLILDLINTYPKAAAYGTAWEFKKNNFEKSAKFNYVPADTKDLIKDYFKAAFEGSLLWSSATVVKKKIYQNIEMFDEKLTHGEDLDMWFRIAKNYNIAFYNKIAAKYFLDSGNRASDKHYLDNTLSQKIINNPKLYLYDEDNKYLKKYITKIFLSKIKSFIVSGNKIKARNLIKILYKKKLVKIDYFKWYILTFIPTNSINYFRRFQND